MYLLLCEVTPFHFQGGEIYLSETRGTQDILCARIYSCENDYLRIRGSWVQTLQSLTLFFIYILYPGNVRDATDIPAISWESRKCMGTPIVLDSWEPMGTQGISWDHHYSERIPAYLENTRKPVTIPEFLEFLETVKVHLKIRIVLDPPLHRPYYMHCIFNKLYEKHINVIIQLSNEQCSRREAQMI